MASHNWPGRRPQVNDPHHKPNYSRFKSAAAIEAHGRELDSHIDVLEANHVVDQAERAALDYHARKAILEALKIEPAMRARTDARTRPNRVAKEPWKRSRMLKMRSHNRLKKKKKKK